MYRILLLLSLVFFTGTRLAAQSDSTCATILRLYNTLGAKDKVERNQYKSGPSSSRPGTLGDVTVYKSSMSIPGFTNPEFLEGGGETRRFSTYAETTTYEAAVKLWDELDKHFHACLNSTWTYKEDNNETDLYKSSKVQRDGSLFTPTIRYRLIRVENKFRLMLEILY